MQRLLSCLAIALTLSCMPALADSATVTARDGWAWRTRAGQYGSAGFITGLPAAVHASKPPASDLTFM